MFKIQGNSFLEILNERTLEALERGHEQGLEQGLAQGVTNIAKKMIDRNDDFSLISEITGLSLQKLNELKAELNNVSSDLVAARST